MANGDPICRRLMTAPGVGPVVALSFMSAVDYPERFKKAEDVGAYFGLTPRQFQSGQTDYMVGISKRGDPMVRHHLVTAATVMMTATKKWCPMKAWGIRIAKATRFFKGACCRRSQAGDHAAQDVDQRAGFPMEVCAQRRIGGCTSLLNLSFRLSNRKGLCRDGRDGDRAWPGDGSGFL